MVNCPRCGATLRPTARFCAVCGTRLVEAAPESRPAVTLSVVGAEDGHGIARAVADSGLDRPPHIQVEPAGATPAPLLSGSIGQEQALFGFRIPTLPDWLTAPTVIGQTEADKLAWVLHSWQQVVANLWKWKRAACALRFVARPAEGVIEIFLLGRVRVPQQSQVAAQALAHDLAGQLAALYLQPQPLDAVALAAARRPVPFQYLLEVHQHEAVVPLNLVDAYFVHPLAGPAGDFRLVFETLLRVGQPVLLSLYLEPTVLTPAEQYALANTASTAQSLADFQDNRWQYYQGRWQDPQAALVGSTYADLVRRLGQPYLCAAHVAATTALAAQEVAHALASAVAVAPPAGRTAASPAVSLPVQCDVVPARTAAEFQALQLALTDLTLPAWAATMAPPGKERLRYLTDAAGAASLVRLPVVAKGGLTGVSVRQIAPGFRPGPQRQAAAADELSLGHFLPEGGLATVKVADLTRHGLIVGFTGSGKTNTCLSLVDQLWRQHHIPILVIEPAKTEYRGLCRRPGFESLKIFTLGDEATAPFRLNPFELLPGIRLETHLAALKSCINAALPQFGVLPTLVEEALIRIYQDKGWELTDKVQADERRLFPTLRDLYTMIVRVVEERGYKGETRDNIRAAAAGRIGSLLAGSKGRMLGCQRSIPMELLFGGPVVLELDALNDDDKALVMMFLLTFLREYCKVNRPDGRLAHVTLIEEAHRVMENVPSMAGSEVAPDTRAEAVRFFAGLLAETRAYGEGILIAEQSPSKLAPDAVRNTNLKIAHMLLDSRDRDAIAGAMIMDEEQKAFLGKLPVGQAALFMTGYERATFIQMPPAKAGGYVARLPDEAVAVHMEPFRQAHSTAYRPWDGCRFCSSPCRYRPVIEPVTLDKALWAAFQAALITFDERPAPADDARNWAEVARACALAAAAAGQAGDAEAGYCYLVHGIDFPFTAEMRAQFVAAWARLGDV